MPDLEFHLRRGAVVSTRTVAAVDAAFPLHLQLALVGGRGPAREDEGDGERRNKEPQVFHLLPLVCSPAE